MNTARSGSVCIAVGQIISSTGTYWCILPDVIQVQAGDILGVELPQNNHEIFFTSGGPVNYIFEHHNQLNSNMTVNLSNHTSYSTAQQLPQIVFNFTSGK